MFDQQAAQEVDSHHAFEVSTATSGGGDPASLAVVPKASAGGIWFGLAPSDSHGDAFNIETKDQTSGEISDLPVPACDLALFYTTFTDHAIVNQNPSPSEGNPSIRPNPPTAVDPGWPASKKERESFNVIITGLSSGSVVPPASIVFSAGTNSIPSQSQDSGQVYETIQLPDDLGGTYNVYSTASAFGTSGTPGYVPSGIRADIRLAVAKAPNTTPLVDTINGTDPQQIAQGTQDNPWSIVVPAGFKQLDVRIQAADTVNGFSGSGETVGGLYIVEAAGSQSTAPSAELYFFDGMTPILLSPRDGHDQTHTIKNSDGWYDITVAQAGEPGTGSGGVLNYLFAEVGISPATYFQDVGGVDLTVRLAWKVGSQWSAISAFRTHLDPIFQPDAPKSARNMPKIGTGGGVSTGVYSTVDLDVPKSVGSWFMIDSASKRALSGNELYTELDNHPAGSSLVITDGSENELGVATLTPDPVNAKNVTVSFSTADNSQYTGTASFDIFYYDHAFDQNPQMQGGAGWSPAGSVTVDIVKQDHAPWTPWSLDNLNFDEGTQKTVIFATKDPYDDVISSSFDFQFSPDGMGSWVSSSDTSPFTSFTVPGQTPGSDGSAAVSVSVSHLTDQQIAWIADNHPDLSPRLCRQVILSSADRAEIGYYVGEFQFFVRVENNTGSSSTQLHKTSGIALASGSVLTIPHDPSSPFPYEMPNAQPGQTVSQVFNVTDPDAGAVETFQISAIGSSTWSHEGVTIPDIGTFTLSRVGNKKTRVTLESSATAIGPYSFRLRATDDTGRVGRPTRVVGMITDTTTSVTLQRLVRSDDPQAAPSILRLCELSSYTDLQVVESVTGPGSAKITVAADEVARKAAMLGLDPVTTPQTSDGPLSDVPALLEQGAIEIVVATGGTVRFCGPISSVTINVDEATIDVEAAGLMSYFEHRAVEEPFPPNSSDYWSYNYYDVPTGSDGTLAGADSSDHNNLLYVGDQTLIYNHLIKREQAKPWGNLLIGTPNANGPSQVLRTVKFPLNDTIAACIDTMQKELLGAEVWIDPQARAFTVAPANNSDLSLMRGRDLRGRLVFTERNSTGISEIYKWDDLATHVRIEGQGTTASTGQTVFGGADTAQTALFKKYGRHVHTLTANNLQNESDLSQLAADYVSDLSYPLQNATITYDANPQRPVGPNDFGVGDLATVEISTYYGKKRYDVRIVNLTITVADGVSDQYQIECQVETLDPQGKPRSARSLHNSEVLSLLYDAVFKKSKP